ncbi:hypothetical protein [Deinococcus multiflagellatus]|uniref:Copper amine oxidase-like N-terminal domain-containing protein n=1 Tax=Deinococcus multiflagellatus TaxID=1656887 RepID=A0ABW1ZJK1_9DEIO
MLLPLTETAAALRLPVLNVTARTATLRVGAERVPVTVRFFGREAYVPLAALSDLPGAEATLERAPAAVVLSVAGQQARFPLNLPQLLPLGRQTEYGTAPSR